MKTLLAFGIIIVIGVVAVAILPFQKTETAVIDKDTVFADDYHIASQEKLVVKNGSILTFEGDLIVDGSLECSQGPLTAIVKGNLIVNKQLACQREESSLDDITASSLGISLVVSGSVVFDPKAIIVSSGSIQLVDDKNNLAITEGQLDELYESVTSASEEPYQLGPFMPVDNNQTNNSQTTTFKKTTYLFAGLVNKAYAAAYSRSCITSDGEIIPNCVRIGGTWIIGGASRPPRFIDVTEPIPGIRRVIININFGQNSDLFLQDFTVLGPDGRNGEDDLQNSCLARGEDGRNGWRFLGFGRRITIRNFTLALGNGGDGGWAETIQDCDPGVAFGGNGGQPGNMRISASNGMDIFLFTIYPGRGGRGGFAEAYGLDGSASCPGTKGGDAVANGGRGGDNRMTLSSYGGVNGVDNIIIKPTWGGEGGNASAHPGRGGAGTGCNCNGGRGGEGSATGGRGGNASVLGYTTESYGGSGGSASVIGGDGGQGGQCNPDDNGGDGGRGGNAGARPGLGGTGQTIGGVEGSVIIARSGNGGDGGDGCNEGGGGPGGSPRGIAGIPGENLCRRTPTVSTSGATGQLPEEPLPEEPAPEPDTSVVVPFIPSGGGWGGTIENPEPIIPQGDGGSGGDGETIDGGGGGTVTPRDEKTSTSDGDKTTTTGSDAKTGTGTRIGDH